MLPIVVDGMGGDYAPEEIVKGAVQAAREQKIPCLLVGHKEQMAPFLHDAPAALEVVHAEEVVRMDEHPKEAVEAKPDASISVAARLLAEGKGGGLVTMGSTGAAIVAMAKYVPRIEGITRTALAALVPTQRRPMIVLDVGANVRSDAADLVRFAIMGHFYARDFLGVESPKVALLSIGEEATKGGRDAEEAHRMLKELAFLQFIGNVEGKDLPRGVAHVVICKGFVGNVMLKLAEGLSETLFQIMKMWVHQSLTAKLGLLLLKPRLMTLRAALDHEEHGGAPLLGFKKLCIIGHGRSHAKAVVNAVKAAHRLGEGDLCGTIQEKVGQFHREANIAPPPP